MFPSCRWRTFSSPATALTKCSVQQGPNWAWKEGNNVTVVAFLLAWEKATDRPPMRHLAFAQSLISRCRQLERKTEGVSCGNTAGARDTFTLRSKGASRRSGHGDKAGLSSATRREPFMRFDLTMEGFSLPAYSTRQAIAPGARTCSRVTFFITATASLAPTRDAVFRGSESEHLNTALPARRNGPTRGGCGANGIRLDLRAATSKGGCGSLSKVPRMSLLVILIETGDPDQPPSP